ncbi:uncharacterized protein [Chelonus insularis]|uniref:uncharacterized protein n=1 Tax=Chelonus insularis TaxID=460826 RepID=UPI0015898F44|nr:uncharacterized protein LOC118068039 [Chelonus insularis]
MIPVFLFLDYYGFLRNESEVNNHSRATTVSQRMPPRSIIGRLLGFDSSTVFLQPGKLSYHDLVSISGPSNSGQGFTVGRVEISEQNPFTKIVEENNEILTQEGSVIVDKRDEEVGQIITTNSVELNLKDIQHVEDQNTLKNYLMIENKLRQPLNMIT